MRDTFSVEHDDAESVRADLTASVAAIGPAVVGSTPTDFKSGGVTAFATAKEIHRSLPIPRDKVVRCLIDQGISDDAMTSPWPLKEAKVKFVGAHTFDFDDSGEPALIFRAADGETIDLVAWKARSGRLASWCNATFCLGDLDDCFNPGSWALGGALRVHRTPLEWLKANRDGLTIVRPDLTYAMLRHVPRLVFADAAYARQVQRRLLPPKPTCQIFVDVQEERCAA